MKYNRASVGWWAAGVCLTVSLAGCNDGSGGTSDPSTGVGGSTANVGGATVSTGGATVAAQTTSVSTRGGSSSSAQGGSASVSEGGAGDSGGSATEGGAASEEGGTTAKGGSSAKGGSKATGGTTAKGGTSSTGGTTPTGGTSSTGGTTAKGGSSAKGGSTATGGSSSTGGSSNTIPMTIPTPTATETRSSTTVLSGVNDLQNKRIGVKSTASCDGEGQPAVFELADGATLKNVIIMGGTPGGNGVVCKGNCTLENVYWEDICEDAATNSKDGATMTVLNSIALNASDKVFQHNAKGGATTVVKNSYISTFGKLWRSCGDCASNGGPRNLVIDNVKVDGVSVCVAGANENYGDSVTITNLFVKGGYSASSDKPKICQVYTAVTDHNGESTKLYGGASQWNSKTCKVTQGDVKSY